MGSESKAMSHADLGGELRSLRRAKPFKPFAFQTTSEGEIHVMNSMRFGTSGDRVCVFPPGGRMRLFHFKEVAAVRPLTESEIKDHNMPAHLRYRPKRPEGDA